MRNRPILFVLIAIASVLAGSSFGAKPCSDKEHNRWATACAWAVEDAELEEAPDSTDPWSNTKSTDILFETTGDLATEWVAACYQVLAEPERIPETSQELLSRLGWPAVGSSCTRESNLLWFQECVADAEPERLLGITRAKLLESFGTEGGISTNSVRTYIHRKCDVLKVRVRFTAIDGSAPKSVSDDDIVVEVEAYVGSFVAD